jgi:RNA polymerase sigma-70 factor (ECF subfamily)
MSAVPARPTDATATADTAGATTIAGTTTSAATTAATTDATTATVGATTIAGTTTSAATTAATTDATTATVGATTSAGSAEVVAAVRDARGPALATLARWLGDVGRAEDAVQDATEVALRTWPQRGVPDVPAAWLLTTARRRAIDTLRRDRRRADLQVAAVRATDRLGPAAPPVDHPVADDQLRLLAACCHPSLAPAAQVCLTLRLVCGLPTTAIARALLEPPATVAQRLTRARRKLRDAAVPLRAPSPAQLPDRLGPMLAVVEVLFARGYAPGDADTVVDDELCDEARRLAGLLAALLPDEPEVHALHALVLLNDARRATRTDADGALVTLERQDRSRWDRDTIATGLAALARAEASGSPPARFRFQARIAAAHATAPHLAATAWDAVVAAYDGLLLVAPTPVVALNRAVALARRDGHDAGLTALAALTDDPHLARGHRLAATRAELLREAGRHDEAEDAYDAALALAPDGAERRHLAHRRGTLRAASPAG